MGGNAFNFLPTTAFPRIPPVAYHVLKARLLPRIQLLYAFAAVPTEAPEKSDHGDLDFVVADPKGNVTTEHGAGISVLHKDLEHAIGAKYSIVAEGNRTSNFAVPIAKDEWSELGLKKEEDASREREEEIYYQIDVHVCSDRAEWERIVFFHAYGDLGMILGLIAKSNGLALGTKGLKLPNIPNPPFLLSESFDEITCFMGLSMDDWDAGFKTKQEAFNWATSTRLFDARKFQIAAGATKVKNDRKMLVEFIQWIRTQLQQGEAIEHDSDEEDKKKVMIEALIFFNRKEEFDNLERQRREKAQLKEVFNENRVREWTGLRRDWKKLRTFMDRVKKRAGGSEGLLRVFQQEGEDGVKNLVLKVREAMVSFPQADDVPIVKIEPLEVVTGNMQKLAVADIP